MTKKIRFQDNSKMELSKKAQHKINIEALNKKTPKLKPGQIDFKAFYKGFFPKGVYTVGEKNSPWFVSSKAAWAYYEEYLKSGQSFKKFEAGYTI